MCTPSRAQGGSATYGSILVIDFDMNSRGAAIQWLSQYPHEEELLFPPCTGLACLDASKHGRKRCVHVSAQVSTARLDTREVTTPDHVPGTTAARRWLAEVLGGCSVEELTAKEAWDLSGKSLADAQLHQRVALLVGRAAAAAAPRVTVVDLSDCQLGVAGAKALAEALPFNASLTNLNLTSNNLGDGETGYVKADTVSSYVTKTYVGSKVIYQGREMIVSKGKNRDGDIKMKPVACDLSGVKALADALLVNTSLTNLS